MKNMKKVLFFALLLVILGVASMSAQVRIGGDGEPNAAAVLDLNVDNTDDGNNGGLALPRVKLINNTTQLNGTAPTKGMLVYNTNEFMAGGSGIGVYFYDGSEWVIISGDGTIATADLADNSVTTVKISDGAVTFSKMSTSTGVVTCTPGSSSIGSKCNITLPSGCNWDNTSWMGTSNHAVAKGWNTATTIACERIIVNTMSCTVRYLCFN